MMKFPRFDLEEFMSIELCPSCNGRGSTTKEEGTNYGTSAVRYTCVPCEGRGCQQIQAGTLTECPACHDHIPVRDIVPHGECRFCGAVLAMLFPKCFLPTVYDHTHTFFHDNLIGVGFGVNLRSVKEFSRGPRAIPVAEHRHIIYPGHDRPYSKVISRFPHHGGLLIELGRLENRDGNIVETVLSRADVTVTQTFGGR